MNLRQLYFTNNDCYRSGVKHAPKGIMWHSTGANNPNLRRYVGPDDGFLGVNINGNHWNVAKPDGRQLCPHGFMGKLKDGSVATYQVLPWDIVCWCSGSGRLGYSRNANNTGYLQIEICEDGLTDSGYFSAIYREAVEVSAYLCKEFSIGPENVICHSEGYSKGIASNHADVMHWFPKHGKSMDTLRTDVKALLQGQTNPNIMYGVVQQVIALGSREKAQAYAAELNAKKDGAYYKVIEIEK